MPLYDKGGQRKDKAFAIKIKHIIFGRERKKNKV